MDSFSGISNIKKDDIDSFSLDTFVDGQTFVDGTSDKEHKNGIREFLINKISNNRNVHNNISITKNPSRKPKSTNKKNISGYIENNFEYRKKYVQSLQKIKNKRNKNQIKSSSVTKKKSFFIPVKGQYERTKQILNRVENNGKYYKFCKHNFV